jgi:hypothetical protein
MRNAHKILFNKLDGKRPVRRPRHRWEDNIKMYLKETRCEDVDWIHLAQDRVQWQCSVNTVVNLEVPKKAVKILVGYETVSFIQRTLFHEVSHSNIPFRLLKYLIATSFEFILS